MKVLTIRVDDELLKKVDDKAKELNITRSAFIKMVLSKETQKK